MYSYVHLLQFHSLLSCLIVLLQSHEWDHMIVVGTRWVSGIGQMIAFSASLMGLGPPSTSVYLMTGDSATGHHCVQFYFCLFIFVVLGIEPEAFWSISPVLLYFWFWLDSYSWSFSSTPRILRLQTWPFISNYVDLRKDGGVWSSLEVEMSEAHAIFRTWWFMAEMEDSE